MGGSSRFRMPVTGDSDFSTRIVWIVSLTASSREAERWAARRKDWEALEEGTEGVRGAGEREGEVGMGMFKLENQTEIMI